MRKNIILVVAVAVPLVLAVFLLLSSKPVSAPLNEDVVTDDQDRIRVTYPLEGDSISSPLVVKGEARGQWYFEASFPVTVVNWDGLIIGEGYAEAQGGWMTTDYVPFIGTIEYTRPDCVDMKTAEWCKRGAVILQKDNPSGLPEHDAAVEIPITFE